MNAAIKVAWKGSLRFRLLVLGLMPLLVAFAFVVGVLLKVGGERANTLLMSKLRAHLSSSDNYLNQLKADTGVRISHIVKSERLIQLVNRQTDKAELDALLNVTAQSSGFDFLVVAKADVSVIIKSGLGRDDFKVDARLLRRSLMDSDDTELPVTSAHAVLVESLPLIHKDPFDRILIAQATAEGFTLLTADRTVTMYPGPIELV